MLIRENLELMAVVNRICEIYGKICDRRLLGTGERIKEEPLIQA